MLEFHVQTASLSIQTLLGCLCLAANLDCGDSTKLSQPIANVVRSA